MDARISQNDSSLNHKISEDGENEFLELIEDEDATFNTIVTRIYEGHEKNDVRLECRGSSGGYTAYNEQWDCVAMIPSPQISKMDSLSERKIKGYVIK